MSPDKPCYTVVTYLLRVFLDLADCLGNLFQVSSGTQQGGLGEPNGNVTGYLLVHRALDALQPLVHRLLAVHLQVVPVLG